MLDWVAEFAVAGDAFFAKKPDRNAARANNWMARRHEIRAMATTVAGLTSEFTTRNYIAGPDLITPEVRAKVLSGLEFLKPYFLRQATHEEFAATTVSFDVVRRDDGNPVFQGPWDPEHGRLVLRLARPARAVALTPRPPGPRRDRAVPQATYL